jgi:hypothetical protein
VKYSGHLRRLLEMINTTEMQQVGCGNTWQLLASPTLPPALLHASDEQKVL